MHTKKIFQEETRMKKTPALLMAVVMLFSLAACSGSNTTAANSGGTAANSSNNGSEQSGQVSQGVTDTEVLIANSAAVSGSYAPVGVPFLAGIEAYLKMINESGGIDGRQVTFLHTDDEFDPVKGKAALQNFVEDEKVFAIVGHFGTPVVGATIEDLKEYGIPSVYFATGIGQLYAENAVTNEEGFNIFPVQPIYVTEGKIMVARGVSNFDAQKIGIIYTNDDAGKDMLQGASEQCNELGIEYVSEQVSAGSADVSAAVTSLKNAGVDFVICAAIQATMPTIVKEMAAQGMTVPVITTYVNVSAAISEQVASDITGKFDVYGNGWVSYEDERAENLALYQEYIDAEYSDNTYAQTGWLAAYFFCEGLRRCESKELTWENYMAALEESPIQNPFGGQIDYSNGTRAGTQEMNMRKVNTSDPTGWELIDGLQSIQSLLS